MNFIAHVSVALSVVAEGPLGKDVAFGAALPDFASMAGLRVERPLLPEPVRQGVALHHRTDSAFHSLEEFRTGVSQLREQLRAAGLAVGPCRAVGHAGWELLLDGCLLDRAGIAEGFAEVLELAPDVAGAVSPANPDRWRRLLETLGSEKWYLGYRDPEMIAQGLQYRLRTRPRLSFGVSEVPLVARALTVNKPSVESRADAVLASVTAAIAESQASS